jgi:phospholipase/lecithinase/hemolysin
MKFIFAMFALLVSSLVSATPLNKMVVFGDSLSDTGNFYKHMDGQYPAYPYFNGRFTDGPVWIELVAEKLQATIVNYAFGGAGVVPRDNDEESAIHHLHQEVSEYLEDTNDVVDENSLYVIWIGANNYLAMPEDKRTAIGVVVDGIEYDMRILIDKGAKHFLIANLPDLGVTPLAYEYEKNSHMSSLTVEHNVMLQGLLNELHSVYPEVEINLLNVGEMFSEVMQYPERFDINAETINESCFDKFPAQDGSLEASSSALSPAVSLLTSKGGYGSGDEGQTSNPCEGYLFFDMVHPTATAHRHLAERTLTLFDNLSLEFEKQITG